MNKPGRRFSFLSAVLAAAVFVSGNVVVAPRAQAQSLYTQPKYAAIVVDATSGEVLYARRADQQRYPASISKVMTVYLVFEALATGRLSLTDPVPISRHAANQAPSKLGLKPGDSLTVDQALRVVATKSANDIAVALAEKIGGTEARFAALMTLRAQELGMTNSRFVNASGLPDSRQISTARDIAILSRAVMRDYPQYYHYFGQKTAQFRGQTIPSHNRLLQKMPGVDGIKTGFTNASGYNLAASAVRDGRRLIAVVLGGSSTAARDENVEDLLTAGFDVLTKRKMGQNITVAANMREPDEASGAILRPSIEQGSGEQQGLRVVIDDEAQVPSQPPAVIASLRTTTGTTLPSLPPPSAASVRAATLKADAKKTATAAPAKGAYRIQVGAFGSQKDARAQLTKIENQYASLVSSASAEVQPVKGAYRARFNGLSQSAAKQACATLSAKGVGCLVLAPG